MRDIALGAALAAAMLAATISISLYFPPDQPQSLRPTDADSQCGAQYFSDLRPEIFRRDRAHHGQQPAWMAGR